MMKWMMRKSWRKKKEKMNRNKVLMEEMDGGTD